MVCTFVPAKGGHIQVRRGERKSYMPQHGGQKQLKTGLMESIKKDLGLK